MVIDKALQGFLLAYHAHAAGHALSAGLMTEECSNPQQNSLEINAVIKQHDHARPERSANGACAFKRKWNINLFGRNKCPCCTAQQNRLQASGAGNASGHGQQLAKRCTHGRFINSGALYMAAKAKQPRPSGTFCTYLCVSCAAPIDDDRNIDQRFHVIDDSRLAKEAGLRGKGRLVARFAAMPFNGIEERRLFTADVSARATADFDIKIQAAAKNILP